jgi:hypothetical protein
MDFPEESKPGRHVYGKDRQRRQQKQESSRVGHRIDSPEVASSVQECPVATVGSSTPDRQVYDKFRQLKRQKQDRNPVGHRTDSPEVASSVQERPVATAGSTQDRQVYAKFRQQGRQEQDRNPVGHRTDSPEVASSVQERPVATAGSTPDQQFFGRFRQLRQQKHESSRVGHRTDGSEVASSEQERPVATAGSIPDRQFFGGFRQLRQQKHESSRVGHRTDSSEVASSEQERPVATAGSKPDRQFFGRFRQRRQQTHESSRVFHRTDRPEVAPSVQEHPVDTAESNPVHVFEESVRQGVQETYTTYGIPLPHASSRNVQYQHSYQNFQHQHHGNVHYQYSYQHVQYQNEGLLHIHTCPCFVCTVRGIQYAHTLQGNPSLYQFQNHPYPFHNSFSFQVQGLPVTCPYRNEPPFVVPLTMPQGPQVQKKKPSHSRQRQQPQEESLILEDNRQEYQNRERRDTHEGLQYQMHEENRQIPQSETYQGYLHGCRDEEYLDNQEESHDNNLECEIVEVQQCHTDVQGRKNEELQLTEKEYKHKKEIKVDEWLSKHFSESDQLAEGAHEVGDMNDEIKGRTCEVEDECGELTGSTREGKDKKGCVSDDMIAQATDQLHFELGIQAPNQTGQEHVQELKYLTYNQQNRLTQSQGVQFENVLQTFQTKLEDQTVKDAQSVHVHESNRQGNSIAENQSPHCSKQDPEGKCAQGSLEISQREETQGAVSTVKGSLIVESESISEGESIQGFKQDPNIQQIEVRGQIPHGLENERTQRDQQKPDDQNSKGLNSSSQPVDARKVMCPFGRLPVNACTWVGELKDRRKHVVFHHCEDVEHGNKVELAPNSARLLIAYDEMFLCYTYTNPITKKLYCAIHHACKTNRCSGLYQYRCELRAMSRCEKIVDTRLVSSLSETFCALMTSGRCARFDDEVARSFMGDNVAVFFTIIRRQEFQM